MKIKTGGKIIVDAASIENVSDGLFVWHPAAAGTTAYGTANNLNQYPTVAGVTQSYNTSGCLTGDGTWTFGYDTENHMLTAAMTGTSASYVFKLMMLKQLPVIENGQKKLHVCNTHSSASVSGQQMTTQGQYDPV